MKNGNWKINRSPSLLPQNVRTSYRRIRLKALKLLGNKCIHCGFSDERALQIDHVNGGGNKDRKRYSGTSFFYHILNTEELDQYQLLCANCNCIKRCERQECKRKYNDDHVFPIEAQHVREYKVKQCKNCLKEFRPTNGRQLRCVECKTNCIKG